eukprot:m.36180 g.36180  ORF g.36180 m.36180 type:complete len:91 (+) comp14456_c0_seq1:164-436(+)
MCCCSSSVEMYGDATSRNTSIIVVKDSRSFLFLVLVNFQVFRFFLFKLSKSKKFMLRTCSIFADQHQHSVVDCGSELLNNEHVKVTSHCK